MADPRLSFSDQFQLKEDLGKGAFSIVKKVILNKTGESFAAKIINTRRLTSRDLQKLEREARICRMLKHHNIVRLHNVFQEDHVRYMIFDLVTGGELFDDIVAREFYSEKDASHCIQQILESVHHCHNSGIIHRDIKPENLLLASKEPGASVKLADFGLAVEAMDGKHYYGFAGTPGYLSPEVLRKEPYAHPVDVWACGVVLYILLVGYPPFWDDDQSKMFEQIKKGKYTFPSPEWDSVTTSAKELIGEMLALDQNKRITSKQILEHPWIRNRDRVASAMHRQETISGLKRFNARRKLKAAFHTVQLVTRKSSAFLSSRSAAKTEDKPPISPTLEVPAAIQEEDQGSTTAEEKEIVDLTQRLLNVIADKDYQEYIKLCSSDITCIEPETCGQLVSGTEFHKFFFDNASWSHSQSTMIMPKVHMMGEGSACIAYTRFTRMVGKNGVRLMSSQETRVWQKFDSDWKCVHFHRSPGLSNP